MEIVDSRITYVGGQGGFFGGIIPARQRYGSKDGGSISVSITSRHFLTYDAPRLNDVTSHAQHKLTNAKSHIAWFRAPVLPEQMAGSDSFVR